MSFDYLKYHKEVISCTFQSLIGYICLVFVFSITCHFAALYLEATQFSGVSLAFSVLGMLIIPLVYAFNQTMNINVSQAMGNGDQLLSLKYLNITLYTHIFIHFFLGGIVYFCLGLFRSFVKESSEEIMLGTKQIYIYFLISQLIFAIYETFKLYLIANKRYTPFKYIHITTTLLHWVWCEIFIVHLNLGLFGLGIATIITQLTNLLLLVIYSDLYCAHYFKGFTCDFIIFKQIDFYSEYLRNSLSNIVQVMADFVIYGVMDILSFQLGMKEMNVQLIFKNTSTLFYKLPQCAAIAMQTYIGTELGQGNVQQAKIYAKVGFIQFSLIFPTLLCSLFLMKQEWASFYSSTEGMQNLMMQDLPYYLFGFELFNGFQGFLSGILKGVEKFDLVSISTTCAFYLIAFPLMMISTIYLKLEIEGLWCGFGCAVAVLCGIYIYSLYQLDWNLQSKVILQKINDSKLLINCV